MPDMLSSFGSEFWMKNRAGIIFYNSNIWCLLQKVAWLGGPNVAPSSQQKHKQSVEKNLQRVKKTTFFFVKVHDFRVSNTSLSVYNADRIRLRSPLWPHLTSWPALGINPGWKIGYIKVLNFNHLLHCLNSAVFLPSVCFVLLQNERGKESCITH